ncbi:MAG: TonB-dependent receptor [Verrucomicrobiota bacterium]
MALNFGYNAIADETGDTITFVQESKPLVEALEAFSKQTGIDVVASGSVLKDKSSGALDTWGSADEILSQLLAGSGLEYRFSGEGTVVITPPKRSKDRSGMIQLENLVLTGELIERTLQDSMTSAAVLTGDEIEFYAKRDVADLLKRVPNLSTAGGQPTIRGINIRGGGGTGTSGATITTTVDGVRISEFNLNLGLAGSTWDLEQVEVLRGPQSTQSGADSLAGAINIRSRDPVHYQEGKVRLGAGNGGTHHGAIAFNAPILEDVLSIRFSAEGYRTDGFVENDILDTDDAAFLDRDTIRLGILWEPNERFRNVLKLTYSDQSSGGDSVTSPDSPRERIRSEVAQAISDAEQRSANLESSYRLTESLSLESSSTYTEFDTGSFGAFEFGPQLIEGVILNLTEFFDQELKLRYETESIQGVVGAYYSDQTVEQDQTRTFSVGGMTVLQQSFPFESSSENRAIFGEIEFDLFGNLRGVLGARYDEEEGVSGSIASEYDAFLPKAGLIYQIDAQKSIGFTYQEAYRAGGARIDQLGSLVPFDPEFTQNYEFAFRSEWLDGGLLFNANTYYTKWKDQQVSRIRGNPPTDFALVTDNSAESELYGAEFEIRATPLEGLEFFAGLGYAHTEFLDYQDERFVGGAVVVDDFSGNSFVLSPEWTGFMGASYLFGDGWRIGADLTYTDETFSDIENVETNRNGAFWIVDLYVSKYFSNGVSVTAFVDNALDKDYTEGITSFNSTPGRPLEFGIFAQYDF